MGKYDSYKEEVLAVAQRLSAEGYFGTKSGTGGNVSVQIKGEEAIAVTPSSKNYSLLKADDICIVDYNVNTIEGEMNPSVEAPMHIAVYKNRRDVSAVIHTHQIYASVFAVINEPIPVLFDEVAVAIGPVIDVVPYGFSGSTDLLNNVIGKLDNRCHCYILQNHGALSIGKNLEKTYHFVELLEKNAMIYCRALATGKQVTALPQDIQDGLFGLTKANQDVEVALKDEASK